MNDELNVFLKGLQTEINTNKDIELSIVVLCYHSANIIERFVEQLLNEVKELNITSELILVANYDKNSGDNTPSIAMQIAKNHHNVLC